MNNLEKQIVIMEFEKHLKNLYGEFQKEVIFNKIMNTKRQFRADYFLPNDKMIIEINGGQWNSGRHNRGGKGYENDLTKLNLAQKNGFIIYQFTYEMLLRKDYENII